MPKTFTDEQINKIKMAMDLMEKTSNENNKLKDIIKDLKCQVEHLKEQNEKLEYIVQENSDKEDEIEIVNDEEFKGYFSYFSGS